MFRFKEPLAAAIVLSVVIVQAGAAEATLTAEVPKGVLLPFRYYATGDAFSKPAEDAGTVNPHAMMAPLDGPIRFCVAVDSSTAEATQPDLVRFDFTGQGRFTDAPTAPLKITQSRGPTMEAAIEPTLIQVPVDGQPVEVRVWGTYEKDAPTYRYLKIGFDLGLKGECDFGQKRYTVCVVDGTGNLRLGDAHAPVVRDGIVTGRTPGDTLMIDTGDGTFKDATKVIRVAYGQPVWIDGAWYQVKVGDDGKSLSAEKLDLPTGRIKVAAGNWEMLLVSPQRVMLAWSTEPGQEVPLPAGQYVVMRHKQYAVKLGDTDSGAILMEGPTSGYQGQTERTPTDPLVEVKPNATVELAIGTPLAAEVEVTLSGREAQFSLKVTDAGGRQPDYVQLKGGRQPVPKIRVLDAEGKQVHAATMQYG